MIEYRNINIEERADKSSRNVSGYAAVFNSQSRDLGFYETIAPGAITEDTVMESDVMALLNHDNDKVLARSYQGVGSLKLSLDGKGLYYSFDAPKNDLGNTLLEHLDRGEIRESSFAFTVSEDTWEKKDDKIFRTINKIDRLYDVSPVFLASYGSTNVAHRNLPTDYESKINEIDTMDKEKEQRLAELEAENAKLKQAIEDRECPKEEEPEKKEEEPKEEETPKEEKECPCEKEEEKEKKECPKEEEPEKEEKECTEENKEEDKEQKNKSNIRKMEKKYSLVEEIRKQANSSNPQSINLIETRAHYSVADDGADVVATDLYNVLPALRDKNVLTGLGARFITGLDKKVQVPVMNGGNVHWAAETGAAQDGSGSFTHVTLEPHRITGKFLMSLELLAMDSTNVEEIIRQDIVNALNEKLQQSILDDQHDATGNRPDGIRYNATETTIANYAALCNFEADLEEKNISGEMKYVLSPAVKALFRGMIKGNNRTGMVLEGGTVDGTEAAVTNSVAKKHAIYGAWENLYIGQFGQITIDVVRDSTTLTNGQVAIIVNAFFDWKKVRPQAFSFLQIN